MQFPVPLLSAAVLVHGMIEALLVDLERRHHVHSVTQDTEEDGGDPIGASLPATQVVLQGVVEDIVDILEISHVSFILQSRVVDACSTMRFGRVRVI